MTRPLPVPGPGERLLPQEGIYYRPSGPNPWRFTRGADQLFTWAQLNAAPLYQLDPASCDYVVVRSVTDRAEFYAGLRRPQPVYLLPCPIIPTVDGEPRADGRLLVIAPAGMKKLVWPDGSIQRPRLNRRTWRSDAA